MSYVNALILESRSIIISSFDLIKSSEEFRFFQKFSDVRTFTNHPPPGMSEISKPRPSPFAGRSLSTAPNQLNTIIQNSYKLNF